MLKHRLCPNWWSENTMKYISLSNHWILGAQHVLDKSITLLETVLSLFWNLHSLVFSCFFNDKKSTGFIEDFTGDVIARFSVRHPSLSMDPPNLCSPHLCVGACFWLCIPVRSSSSSYSSCPALSLTHNSHTQQLTHTQLPYTQLPQHTQQ